jgi:hypothetical protein
MSETGITLLLSHERSGSHLLGEYFGSLQNVAMLDEVCNPFAVQPQKSPMSFYRFRHEAIGKDAGILMQPTRERHDTFVASYFEHLKGLRPSRNVVVDIKYGHVHNFELFWWPVFERPFLMQFCEQRGIGIVHLFRENIVEATASALIADQRKVWHSWEEAAAKTADQTFRLPVQTLVWRAKNLQRQIDWFKECTATVRRVTVTYEALARELGSGGELDESLENFVGGHRIAAFRPRHQKVTRPLADIVENFSDLKQACEAAGLGGYLT